jgi:hypothetical protein
MSAKIAAIPGGVIIVGMTKREISMDADEGSGSVPWLSEDSVGFIIICKGIKKRIIPPVRATAAKETPQFSKMSGPTSARVSTMAVEAKVALIATLLQRVVSALAVSWTNGMMVLIGPRVIKRRIRIDVSFNIINPLPPGPRLARS